MQSADAASANAVNGQKVINYCGNIIYDGDETMVLNDGGYAKYDKGGNLSFHYYLKDHLGDNRVVVNESGVIEQTNDYYPTGALMGSSTNGDVQRYKYNGKELDRMNGLDWHDYGTRIYDAAIVIWNTLDKLAEKDYSHVPYVYCGNNPTRYLDIKGLEKLDALSQKDRNYKRLEPEIKNFKDDPNVINIWAHGYDNGNSIILNKEVVDNAEKFEKFLESNSFIWKTREGNAPITIVLHSCSASKFAKAISNSKKFDNVIIIAPTTPVNVLTKKNTKSYLGSYLENNGIWKSYKAGREIKSMTYGKHDYPGSIYPRIKFNLIKELSNHINVWKK